MKDLKNDDLFDLAYSELKKMEKNTFITTILCIIVLIQSLFVLSTGKWIFYSICLDVVCFLLYIYHDLKYKKGDELLKEVLEELDKREL